MSDLVTGALTQGTGPAQVDSILPVSITSSKTLVPGVDAFVFADPTTGNIELTLPTPIDGVVFEIHRIINGNNTVKAVGQSINGQSNGVTLGLPNQFIILVGDATNNMYRLASHPPSQFATVTRTTDLSFSATTSFVKYTDWETVLFSTPGVLLASITTDDIELANFEADPQAGYRVDFTMNLEAGNNNNCFARFIFDGTVGAPIVIYETARNGLGSGKPVNLNISGPFAVSETGFFRIELSAESANTWTVLDAKLDIARIVD